MSGPREIKDEEKEVEGRFRKVLEERVSHTIRASSGGGREGGDGRIKLANGEGGAE